MRRITREQARSAVIVSHDARIGDIDDRVLWLDDGRSLELDRLERDPLCGMATERGRAIAADVAGEVHYFCSDGCREAFFAGSTHGAVTTRA